MDSATRNGLYSKFITNSSKIIILLMDYNLKATYRSGRQYFFLKGADSGWLEFGQMTKFTYSFLLQPNLTQGKKAQKNNIFALLFQH